MAGILYGVGVGPGDPELMTLKAVRLIRECQVIAAPGAAPEETVAYQIAVQAVPELNTSLPEVNSVFEIPIGCWDREMPVIADTTAMGTPHEIQYTLTFYESSIAGKGSLPREAAKRVVVVALVIIVGGGILNYCVKKRRAWSNKN